MHTVERAKLVGFREKKENKDSKNVLDILVSNDENTDLVNLAQLREVYRHADIIGECRY